LVCSLICSVGDSYCKVAELGSLAKRQLRGFIFVKLRAINYVCFSDCSDFQSKILKHFVTWFDLLRQFTVSTFNLHSVASSRRYRLDSFVACTSGSSD